MLTGKAHGETPQEQRLARVRDHGPPDLRVQRVPQHRDGEEDDEEDDVGGEEDVRDVLQPLRVPGQVVQQHRDDTRAHVDGEPSGKGKIPPLAHEGWLTQREYEVCI